MDHKQIIDRAEVFCLGMLLEFCTLHPRCDYHSNFLIFITTSLPCNNGAFLFYVRGLLQSRQLTQGDCRPCVSLYRGLQGHTYRSVANRRISATHRDKFTVILTQAGSSPQHSREGVKLNALVFLHDSSQSTGYITGQCEQDFKVFRGSFPFFFLH